MNKREIIERLKNIAGYAVHTVGEEPFVMSLDDGIAVHEAIELLNKPDTNCSEIPNNWIPCSERQPDVNGWYITTISGEICGQDRAFSGMSEFANGKWMSGDDVDETEMTIAWKPLPEPYQEGEQK